MASRSILNNACKSFQEKNRNEQQAEIQPRPKGSANGQDSPRIPLPYDAAAEDIDEEVDRSRDEVGGSEPGTSPPGY